MNEHNLIQREYVLKRPLDRFITIPVCPEYMDRSETSYLTVMLKDIQLQSKEKIWSDGDHTWQHGLLINDRTYAISLKMYTYLYNLIQSDEDIQHSKRLNKLAWEDD